jgi:hypothetical protein
MVLAGLCIACQTQAPGQTKRMKAVEEQRSRGVLTIQRQISLTPPADVAYTPSQIMDATFSARPRASAQGAPGVLRFLSSAAQNSRLPAALKPGTWSLLWSYDSNPQVAPAAILEFRNHVLVQQGDWLLLNADGRKLASGQIGRSALTGDGSTDLFYLVNQANHLEARSLSNGELQFRWPMAFGEAFSFPFMSRTGSRIMMAGVEHRTYGHPPIEPTMGFVYVVEMSGVETDATKLLHSVSRSDTLYFKEPRMLSAIGGERVMVATPGYLAAISSDLQLDGVFQGGDFEPTLLSVDESAWMHLIVRQGSQRSLWLVSPEGRRVVNTRLSHLLGDIAGPPAIGYDRRIYLWTKSAVVAFAADGKLLWERTMSGEVAGIGVTADDRVIVGAGSDVSVLDAAGEPRILYRFEGETISAPPILALNGDVLVATKSRVHRLKTSAAAN